MDGQVTHVDTLESQMKASNAKELRVKNCGVRAVNASNELPSPTHSIFGVFAHANT